MNQENNKPSNNEKQSQKILKLVEALNIISGDNGNYYAEINNGVSIETWPLNSDRVQGYLQEMYYNAYNDLPDEKLMKRAIETSIFKAHKNPKISLYYRIAKHYDTIFIDVGDSVNSYIRVDANGWEIRNDTPSVKFYKSHGMKALPLPEKGGNIQALKKFVNIRNDDDFILLLSFILGSLVAGKQYPILILQGPQGCGKSTACEVVKAIIDPNLLSIRSLSKKEEDFFLAAKSCHLMVYDNLSGINATISDTLCKISTGCGISSRKLYTNDEEFSFQISRPIIINGIDDLTSRGDLADRAIIINLDKMQPESRNSISELEHQFQIEKAKILGCMCDALSMSLRNRKKIIGIPKHRHVDFYFNAVSGLQALGYSEQEIIEAFEQNKREVAFDAVELNAVGRLIKDLMNSKKLWQGSATELLTLLNSLPNAHSLGHNPQPNFISRELNRIAPSLEIHGISIEHMRTGTQRLIVLKKFEKQSSSLSLSSQPPLNAPIDDGSDSNDDITSNFWRI